MLDVNETWGRHQAVRLLARVESCVELAWIEEPVRRWDVAGNRAVGRAARTAVATGENLTGLEQFRPLVAGDAVQVVQTGSVWGITHFLRVATLAHGHDLPVSPVGYETNPSRTPPRRLPTISSPKYMTPPPRWGSPWTK